MSSDTDQPARSAEPAPQSGFFVNQGTLSGHFTTPDGDVYDIRKLEPREVADPRSGEVATIWGGYASARDRELAARDAMLQADFRRTGERPAALFAPESKDIPLYITLRNRPGPISEKTGRASYTDIGSLWTSKGRYTILARDLAGKAGLRFGGSVLPWKAGVAAAAETPAAPAAEPGVDSGAPDAAAARRSAATRAGKSRAKTPTADA